MTTTRDTERLEEVCGETLAALGFELVAVDFGRGPGGFVLRVYIDGPGGVTIDDCARASRDLSAALDVADVIDRSYSLEVSSPGLDRPLVRERDFVRFAGKRARLRTREPIEGRRNFSGTLRGVAEGRVAIECDGHTYAVPLEGVVKAHLEVEI
jgi:ribosome maturation factor RimP